MKKEVYIALSAGAAVAGFAAYLLFKRNKEQPVAAPLIKNEQSHLTPVFSRAKRKIQGEG